MVDITNKVHKIEEILYGNEFTKEKGIIENVKDMSLEMVFFKRFLKWFSGILAVISAAVIALLGIGVKYNIDLIKEVSALAAQLTTHMAK
jgi:hypothetical protein